MKLNQIPKHATILASDYLHTHLRMKLLEHTSAIGNIAILSPSAYLLRDEPNQEDVSFYQYIKTIGLLELHLFQSVAKTCEFVEEIYNFVGELKAYNLDLNNLPQADAYEQELIFILEAVFDIERSVDREKQALEKASSFEGVYLVSFYQSLYETMQASEMLHGGAIDIEQTQRQPNKEFYYVLNKREEVEALARYIIKNDIDASNVKVTLLDEDYKVFVSQIFQHYNIPYSFVSEHRSNRLVYKYIALLSYYFDPSYEQLLALVEEEVFQHKYMYAFKEYIVIYKKSLQDNFKHLQHLNIQHEVINEREFEKLQALEQKAEVVAIFLKDILAPICEQDIVDALPEMDQCIVASHNFTRNDDHRCLQSIRSTILGAKEFINQQDIPILYFQLKKLKVSQSSTYQGVLFSNLTSPLDVRSYHILLGATSKNYPSFPARKGIFNEDYVARFEFPSLAARYELHQQQCTQNLHSSEHLIVFYSTSSFQGKDQEAALSLEKFMGMDASYVALPYAQKQYKMNTRLHGDLAKELFLKGQTMYGSVSSLEMYRICPFRYFVKKGLNISEPLDYNFNEAVMGTFMHHIFETLTKTYKQDYALVAMDVVEPFVDEVLQDMIQVYPYLKQELVLAKQQLLESIDINLTFLKSFEGSTSLIPEAFEYPFDYDMKLSKVNLQLKGFIDRINANADFVSIIDYKSSKHVLKEVDVFSGLKLQLLTYLLVVSKQFNKRVIGAHYYSFQNKKQKAQYASRNRKGEVVLQEADDYLKAFLKEKRLEGWMFSKHIEVLDQSENQQHVNGFRLKKDGSYAATTSIYHIDKIESLLLALYDALVNEILEGNMNIEPSNCAFCPYNSVCHFKGTPSEREAIVEPQDIYIVEKGKEVVQDEV